MHLVGTFLVNNYRQALDIIKTKPILMKALKEEQIDDSSIFVTWLQKEKNYLRGLAIEPVEETQHMEYYQSLVNLRKYEYVQSPILRKYEYVQSPILLPQLPQSLTNKLLLSK